MFKALFITEDFSELPITQDTRVCLIIEHIEDTYFLAQLADKLLDLPCRVFDFYGKYRGRGETIFDYKDIERGYTEENIALTGCYNSLSRLANSIYVETSSSPSNILILYDDLSIYHQLLELIRKRHPWRVRRHLPKVRK